MSGTTTNGAIILDNSWKQVMDYEGFAYLNTDGYIAYSDTEPSSSLLGMYHRQGSTVKNISGSIMWAKSAGIGGSIVPNNSQGEW